jgi:hypothetical protein
MLLGTHLLMLEKDIKSMVQGDIISYESPTRARIIGTHIYSEHRYYGTEYWFCWSDNNRIKYLTAHDLRRYGEKLS